MRHAIVRVSAAVMIVSGAPAIASAQAEKGTIAVGYAALQQPDRRFPGGWMFAATRNFDRTLALVGEIGGSYTTEKTGAGDVNLRSHSVLAGLRIQRLVAPRVTAFAHALVGGTFFGASGADDWSDHAFAVQPGAGIDIRVAPYASIRIQGDARSNLAGFGEGFGELRLAVGAVFGFGRDFTKK